MDWMHWVSRKGTAALQKKDLTGMELPLKEWLSQNQLLHFWSLQSDLQWKHTNWSKNSCWWGKKKINDDIGCTAHESWTPFLSQLTNQVHLPPSRGSALSCLHSSLRISSIPRHQLLLLLKLPDTNQSWSNLLQFWRCLFVFCWKKHLCT